MIDRILSPGTYYIAVSEPGNDNTLPGYRLRTDIGPFARIQGPASPGNDATPALTGAASPGSTVQIFTTADCSGASIASGPASQFAASGIEAPANTEALALFFAKATGPGLEPNCSSAFRYLQSAAPVEVEPNDTITQANERADGNGVVISDDKHYVGDSPPGIFDLDVYKVVLSARTGLRFETTSVDGAGCAAGMNTSLELRDAAGNIVAANNDADCSLIARTQDAGTYYIFVGSDTRLPYRLKTNFIPSAEITSSNPTSPSANTSPRLIGTVTPGANVEIHTTADCSGAPVATGSASTFTGIGIQVTVPPESSTQFRAKAVAPGGEANCSSPFTYVHTSAPSEVEPNNTTTEADARASGDGILISTDRDYLGAITPVADKDVYKVQVTTLSSARFETFGPDGVTCPGGIDTLIRLLDSAGAQIVEDDEGSQVPGNCSLITRPLSPGVYYLSVEEFQNNAQIAGYRLKTTFTTPVAIITSSNPASPANDNNPELIGQATAGGNVEIYKNATCTGVPAGAGSPATFETPGITVSVDDDSQTNFYAKSLAAGAPNCAGPLTYTELTTPSTPEVEPNNDQSGADAAAINPSTDATIGGAIGSAGDLDAFKFTVPSTGVVRLETFSGAAGADCQSGITTTLRVRDSAFTQLTSDTNAGIVDCSALVLNLAAGTYYAQVEESGNNAAISAYRLQIDFQVDDGVEVEPNESAAAATAFSSALGRFKLGNHSLNADSDFHSITVADGQSIRAEVIEGGVETCESNGVDSRLTLFSPALAQLADDDDDARGFCSLLDGTGSTKRDAGAGGLAAGTYYLQVRASSLAQSSPGGQFDYRLQVTVR